MPILRIFDMDRVMVFLCRHDMSSRTNISGQKDEAFLRQIV